MAKHKVEHVAVRGVVCAVPGSPIALEDLGLEFEPREIERIKRTVGLRQLHRVRQETAGDLCIAAAEELLKGLEWAPGSVDAVFMVTQQPDHFLPATACVAHQRLRLGPHAAAFDIGLGCSGYVYGMLVASRLANANSCRRVLLLAGDTISRVCAPGDKATALLFGDAGSATALEWDDGAGEMSFISGTDGAGVPSLMVPAGGFREPVTAETAKPVVDASGNVRSRNDLLMDGLAVFAFSLQRVPPLVDEVLEYHGWNKADCQSFLLHQANGFMLATLGKKIGLAANQLPVDIDRYGNTSSASIPLLLADDLAEDLQRQARRVAMVGFGVGFSWAAMAGEIGPLAAAGVIQVESE